MTHPNATTTAPPKRRRTRRLALHLAWVAAVTLAVGIIIITQSGLLTPIVLPVLRGALPCGVDTGRITLSARGTLVVRDLRLTVPDLAGQPAEFLRTPLAEIRFSIPGALSGNPDVQAITLTRPLVRLSQAEDLTLNVQALRGAGGAPATIPEIRVDEGRIEIGEHTDTSYARLVTIPVEGSFQRQPDDPTAYAFFLDELPAPTDPEPDAAPDAGMRLAGQLNLARVRGNVALSNVDLAQWDPTAVPSPVRNLWQQLDLRGRLRAAEFRYDETSGPVALLLLDSVSLNAPLPAENAPSEPLRMNNVTGELEFRSSGLRAELTGDAGGVYAEVQLRTLDLSPDAALECRIETPTFRVADNPGLLPYAPAYVERIFRRFSGPTADVDGVVEIRRGPPTPQGPAELEVSGAFVFENGQASYESFNYPVTSISGTVNFDPEKIDIVQLNGSGPSGAAVLASGLIAPPREGAAVNLLINMAGVPIDDYLYEALPPDRRPVVDAVFSQRGYQRLTNAGLVVPPDEHDQAQQQLERARLDLRRAELDNAPPRTTRPIRDRIDTLQNTLAKPVFEPGGTADIVVEVDRPFGLDANYTSTVRLSARSARIIPDNFHYPAEAERVRVELQDRTATIRIERLAGLTGAQGDMNGTIVLGPKGTGEFTPDLRVTARDIPVDDFLLAALPDDQQAAPLLRRLGVQGTVATDARISPQHDNNIGYDVDVNVADIRARPLNGPLVIDNLAGEVRMTNSGLVVRSLTGAVGRASFNASLDISDQGDAAGAVTVDNLDLAEPFELFIRALTNMERTPIADLRERYDFSGRIDLAAWVQRSGDDTSWEAEILELDRLDLDLFEARAGILGVSGAVRVRERCVTFDDFRGATTLDGHDTGPVHLSGSLGTGQAGCPTRLALRLQRLDTALPPVRHAIRQAVPGLADQVERYDVAATIDTRLNLTDGTSGVALSNATLAPTTLAFTNDQQRVAFTDVQGTVRVQGTGAGRVEDLRVNADTWTATATGPFRTGEDWWADLGLSVEGNNLPPDLVNALPAPARAAIDAVELALEGPFSMRRARLSTRAVEGADKPASAFEGTVRFADASLRAAVPITELSGNVDITIRDLPELPATDVRVLLNADTARLFGLSITDAVARLESTPDDRFVLPLFQGEIHGGRLVGRAAFGAPNPSADDDAPPPYELQIEAAGIDFASALAEATEQPADVDRGSLDASLAIRRDQRADAPTLGRGFVRVRGGDVVNLPGVVPLLRLSNLQLPVRERLDFAYTDFYLHDDTVHFEDLQAESPSLAILGAGTLTLPDLALDLRFRTRGTRRIPLLSDLFEGLRDELITTRVTGTLRDPDFDYESFTATRGVLDQIFGPDSGNTQQPRPETSPDQGDR